MIRFSLHYRTTYAGVIYAGWRPHSLTKVAFLQQVQMMHDGNGIEKIGTTRSMNSKKAVLLIRHYANFPHGRNWLGEQISVYSLHNDRSINFSETHCNNKNFLMIEF